MTAFSGRMFLILCSYPPWLLSCNTCHHADSRILKGSWTPKACCRRAGIVLAQLRIMIRIPSGIALVLFSALYTLTLSTKSMLKKYYSSTTNIPH